MGGSKASRPDSYPAHETIHILAINSTTLSNSFQTMQDTMLEEAIYKFKVEDMPVSVAVDVNGTSIHAIAPKIWQAKIGKIPVVDAAAE